MTILKRFLLLLLVLFPLNVFAQTETSQIVLPKRVYVGDTAELRFTFHSNVDFFPGEDSLLEKTLDFSRFPFNVDNQDFTLKSAIIQKNGRLYTVVFTFSAWKTGPLTFPEFDLLYVVFGTKNSVPFLIKMLPIEISSIIPKGEDVSMRGMQGPLLFPGTIYVIYGVILLFVLILILVVNLVIKRQEISSKIKERRVIRLYAKNARSAMRQLKKLEKNSVRINDIAFCLALQQIFRHYLSVRFGLNFTSISTSQIFTAFENLYDGSLSDFLRETVWSVQNIFKRADYIRFAHDSSDSKRKPEELYSASLKEDERENLIKTSRTIIKAFETGGEDA